MTKANPKKKAPGKKRLPVKRRSGVIPDLKASAEPMSIYAGNSARMDEARDAYERAEAWAQSPAGTPYGARKATR
jgi:hypothetical protein